MAEELQKQSAETLTFQKTPEKFLVQVGEILETFQKVYRQKLPPEELKMWRETLKDYSFQEFQAAMGDLVANPPRYVLDDGSIQVWRGMPKLPDVVNVMLDARETRAIEYRRQQSERESAEMRELAKRREEHPEEFMGLPEFIERLTSENPELAARANLSGRQK